MWQSGRYVRPELIGLALLSLTASACGGVPQHDFDQAKQEITSQDQKIKALHLPVKGLMDVLGIELADLIKTGKVRGIEVNKDDLILDPGSLLPPPHISGKVTDVKTRSGQIVQVFGNANSVSNWKISSANYMAYRNHQLRFGKLTMSDTDLVLIDMDPKDRFDFYLDHYKE